MSQSRTNQMRRRKRALHITVYVCVLAITAALCSNLEDKEEPVVIGYASSGSSITEMHGDINSAPSLESTGEAEESGRSEEITYTRDDVIALAQMAWGEALVTGSDTEMTASMWCACNRLDSEDPYYENCKTIYDIVTQKGQFHGYRESNPIDDHLVWLAEDVLKRWTAEKKGATDVGRTLPAEYCFFWGDGIRNHYTTKHQGGTVYDWSLESPYES